MCFVGGKALPDFLHLIKIPLLQTVCLYKLSHTPCVHGNLHPNEYIDLWKISDLVRKKTVLRKSPYAVLCTYMHVLPLPESPAIT